MAVNNAVSRIKILRRAADRRCLFNEYKEWLGESIDDEVLAIPSEIIQNEEKGAETIVTKNEEKIRNAMKKERS